MENEFNEDYYERGVEKRLSGYTNYRWMPGRTIAEAADIIKYVCGVEGDDVLDYGCAKGYLVHALRVLGVDAYGEDISEYAVENAHPPVKEFVSQPTDKKYDTIIAKDILEHVPETELTALIQSFEKRAEKVFAVIPLGDDNKFRIREYEMDVTHVTKKDEEWWINIFKENGYQLTCFSHKMGDVKKNWTDDFPLGNGFFEFERIRDEL